MNQLKCVVCALVSASVIALISSCGGGKVESTAQKVGTRGYKVIGAGEGLTHTGSSVSGSGTIYFVDPIDQGTQVDPEFTLKENGKLKIVFNTSDNLIAGVFYQFERNAGGVTVTYGTAATTNGEITDQVKEAITDPAGTIALRLIIHNEEGHVLVKTKDGGKTLVNIEGALSGKGTGNLVAAQLTNATLTNINFAPNKEEE